MGMVIDVYNYQNNAWLCTTFFHFFLCIEFLNIGRQKKVPTIENHLSVRPWVYAICRSV